MRSVRYGTRKIDYSIHIQEGLTSHYITVEKHEGVVLKGKPVTESIADRLILKKAKWIINKMELVRSGAPEDIVTGSRIPYLGKSYYVQVKVDKSAEKVRVDFNHSKFIITVGSYAVDQAEIQEAIQLYYKTKAIEKIGPRVVKLSANSGLTYKGLQFRKMSKRWGSCTGGNRIIINTEAVKLPFSLIDYLILHELVHTRIKNHSKAYYTLLAKYVRGWKRLDERMRGMKM